MIDDVRRAECLVMFYVMLCRLVTRCHQSGVSDTDTNSSVRARNGQHIQCCFHMAYYYCMRRGSAVHTSSLLYSTLLFREETIDERTFRCILMAVVYQWSAVVMRVYYMTIQLICDMRVIVIDSPLILSNTCAQTYFRVLFATCFRLTDRREENRRVRSPHMCSRILPYFSHALHFTATATASLVLEECTLLCYVMLSAVMFQYLLVLLLYFTTYVFTRTIGEQIGIGNEYTTCSVLSFSFIASDRRAV